MKKTIITTILSLITVPCFAAVTMECTAKSLKVRQAPEVVSPMVGGIVVGEKVTFVGKSGRWSKIQFKNGKEGYVFSSYLKLVGDVKKENKDEVASPGKEPLNPAVVENESDEERSILDNQPVANKSTKSIEPVSSKTETIKLAKSVVETVVAMDPEAVKKPEPVKMKTITLAADRESVEAISTLKATNEALLKELAAMRQERAEMAALKKEISDNIRCVVKEREENEKRTKHAEDMQKKAEVEIADIKSTLVLGGNARLLALADNGDKAYFKGVGEVNLAFEGGRTVLRVVEVSMAKAEKALVNSNPEKFLRNGYAYFVVDSKSLASF